MLRQHPIHNACNSLTWNAFWQTHNYDEHGILSIDPTYNLGQFYVTPTTYPHLMLEDVTTSKHPSVLGLILVHQRVNFSAFHYFASSLIGLNKNTRNLRAFGTDGQEPLIDAFSHSFPSAVQLRCFIHFKRNVFEKLREYGIPSSVAEEFIADILASMQAVHTTRVWWIPCLFLNFTNI